MTEPRVFRRGEVVLAAVPFITNPSESKIRPVVIIQNDVGNRFSANVIVAGITSQLPRRQYPTNLTLRRGSAEAEGNGLDRDSTVQAEFIATISKSNVVQRLGQLSEAGMRGVDARLKVSLALT